MHKLFHYGLLQNTEYGSLCYPVGACLPILCMCKVASVVFRCLQCHELQPARLLCLGFSRLHYWSGLPSPPLGDLPDPGIKPMSLMSPALTGCSLSLTHLGSPHSLYIIACIYQSQIHSLNSSFPPHPFGNHKSILYVSESVSVLYISSFMSYFRFHI